MALSSMIAHRPTLHRRTTVALCLAVCALCLLFSVGFAHLGQPVRAVQPPAKTAPVQAGWQRPSFSLPVHRTVPLIQRTLLTSWHVSNVSPGRTFLGEQMVGSLMVRVPLQDCVSSHCTARSKRRTGLNEQVASIPLLI
ncbi:MAG: hypothetical protein IT324_26965 [Anaerolineae bacterium]|nr:hypothetical protein [Anaerolineae bacterium]